MHLRSLTHLVESVQALTRAERIVVLGSSSLLATAPELGRAGQPLELSYDADLLLAPTDDDTARIVHEAVGEGSLFHRRHACFAHVLRPEIAAALPDGWERRLAPLPGHPGVACLDPHDLALVKLALGRDKDLELLAALLKRRILQPDELRRRFHAVTWDERTVERTGRNLLRLLGPDA